MKWFLVCLVAIIGSSTASPSTDKVELGGFIENTINKTLEALKKVIPDPLNVNELDLNFDGMNMSELLTGFFNASNTQVVGTHSYRATYLKYHIFSFKLDYTIMIDYINLYSKYVSDLVVASLIPFYGDGKVNVNIQNINISGSASVSLNPIGVKNLTIYFDLGDATFSLHGLINNEDFSALVSSLLNDVVPTFIHGHQDLISEVLSPLIQGLIDAVLHPKKLESGDIYYDEVEKSLEMKLK